MYRRDITPRVTRVRYRLQNFRGVDAEKDPGSLSLDYCVYGYNIGFLDGALTNGIGIGEPVITLEDKTERTLPNLASLILSIKQLFLYRRRTETGGNGDMLIALADDNFFYKCDIREGGFTKIEGMQAAGGVSLANYYTNGKDTLIVSLSSGGMYLYDGGSPVFYPEAPGFNSVCIHYDRLFGENGQSVYFSKALSPAGWDVAEGAGYISLMDEGGKIVKVVSFKDYIFIFREHAVHRLTAFADPAEYKVTKVFETDCLINAQTVTVADDRILFLADGGLYSFDGYSARRVYQNVTALIDGYAHAAAAYYNNRYYLAVKMKSLEDEKVGDEKIGAYKNNAVFTFNLLTGEAGVFRGGDVKSFVPLISGSVSCLLTIFNNFRKSYIGLVDGGGSLFGEPLEKLWVSPKTNFGSLNEYKVLRRIYISSLFGVTVKTGCGGKETVKAAYGGGKPELLTYNGIGDTVRLKLETENDKMFISGILLELDFSRRYYAD